jgi:hypothetical protein
VTAISGAISDCHSPFLKNIHQVPKVANNRNTFTVRESGVFRGGLATCYKVQIEDNVSVPDFDDVLLYLVFLENIPPAGWNIDHLCFGVQGVPVMVRDFVFDERAGLEPWGE